VIVNADNESHLNQLIEKAKINQINLSKFIEPDLDNQVTAIALAPGDKSKRLCKNLKLALRDQ
jgi:hypothetical protein